MTDRGLPIVDGAPACPFVAFEDDRDGRATAPDHGHRCFAEPRPAQRALAHQAAYCLSSAFPVCPTFQDWARREAAIARQAPTASGGTPEPPVPPPASRPLPPRELDARHANDTDTPAPVPPRRNPPRGWAAPPPWNADAASMPDEPAAPYPEERGARRAAEAAAWGVASQGLAGSAADRLAGHDWEEPLPDRPGSAARQPASRDAYEPEHPAPPPGRTAQPRSTPTRRPPQDPNDLFGPAWERPRRYEAYPNLRTRVGLPGFGRPSGLAIGAIALVLAAVGLFFVGPMLLGIGSDNDDPGRATPTPVVGATATPRPTPVPEPTPQIYVVAKNDTLSKIAKKFGITLEELQAANPEIKNPNRIKIGQEITIPVPVEDDAGAGGAGGEGGEATPPPEVP